MGVAAGGGLYLYGVVPSGIETPEGVETIVQGAVQALAARVELAHWETPRLCEPDVLAQRAHHHDEMLRSLLPQCTPLPMRMGTILRCGGDVAQWLRANYAVLAQLLEALAGREEWGLKLALDASALAPAPEPVSVPGAGEGMRYILRKQRDRAVARVADEAAQAVACSVSEEFAPLVERWLSLPPRPGFRLNEALLVARDRASLLREQRDAANARVAGHGEVTLTGPWPPYSFVPALPSPERP